MRRKAAPSPDRHTAPHGELPEEQRIEPRAENTAGLRHQHGRESNVLDSIADQYVALAATLLHVVPQFAGNKFLEVIRDTAATATTLANAGWLTGLTPQVRRDCLVDRDAQLMWSVAAIAFEMDLHAAVGIH
ncbi:hypothetical protein GCM10022239_17950 [Leifsonia bigeumensis]|uniref:Uncharacterized protein n=1 Tax=Leifsonella bigeumensis TaxID=433643 RepID=A0ABP7FSL2_9MICO